MVTAALAATALLLIATGTIALRQRDGIGVLVGLLCVSIAYDAAIIAFGTPIGVGSALQALNTGRYWLHALLTPLAIIAAAAIAARLGVRSLASLGGRILTGTLTAALIAVGVATEA